MPKRKCNPNPITNCDKVIKSSRRNIFIDDFYQIKEEPTDSLSNKCESHSTTVESLQSDISEFANDESFSMLKNKINLLGSHETFHNSEMLEKIMTKLNAMDDKINDLRLEFRAFKRIMGHSSNKNNNNNNSNNKIATPTPTPTPTDKDNTIPVNDDVYFNKCQSVEEVIELAESLQNKETYSKLLNLCSKLGGNEEYDCTYRILKFLTRKDILGRMNKSGTFNKTKFPTILSHLIYESIMVNFDCTFAEIEKSVGRVLHNCIPDAKKSFLK